MTEQLRYDGKVVIITGAGNGLGRSHALMFGARGAKVVVNDLGGSGHGEGKSSAAADKVVEEIKALGGEAVANYNSVEDGDKIVQTALDAFGTVDIVINNAGILRDVSFQKMSQEDWSLLYRVHLEGAFRVTHAAWPILRDKGYGRIIMTTSAAGIYGNFGQANYSAMKMGLVGLANTLALEGKGKNILVNTIAPIAASRLTETVLPPEILEHLKPEYVSPLVGWLCHESSTENGGLFEVGAATVNKLRWEKSRGHGFRVNSALNPEDFAAKWDKIVDFTDATHPQGIAESMTVALDNINHPKLGGNEFIDLDAAAAQPPVEMQTSYDERDLSLYALGVGAGADPLDASDLRLIHERGDKFFPLPTYGVMPALNGFMKAMQQGTQPAGLNVGFDRVLHGEQYTEIKRPLPAHATLTHKAKLRTAYDKGKDAIGIVDIHSFDEAGDEIAYNEISFFLRGAGGWGGDRGPSGEVNVPPQREPDAVIEEKIGESQALLYRLSGDWNPLHVDPEFARNFGFERPILHGLCTYGYVGRHVIKAFLNNDPRRFKSIKVRFAKSVYPGDTLVTRMWKESDLRIVFETTAKERNEVVIKAAAVELYAEIPQAKPKATAAVAAAVAPVQDTRLLPQDVFAVIGRFVGAHPELIEKTKTSFQFNLTNPDSSWSLDLKNGQGEAREGTLDKPDVTLTFDQDLLETVVTAPAADVQKLFFGGQLKISGNMMAGGKLSVLQTITRQDYEAEKAKRLAAGAVAVAVAPAEMQDTRLLPQDVFAVIGKFVAAHPELIEKTKTSFQFNLTNPDSSWSLDLKNGRGEVREGTLDKPDVTLTFDQDLLETVVTAPAADVQKLFFGGQLKISGNMMAGGKLSVLQTITKQDYESEKAKRLGDAATAPAAAAAPAATSSNAAPKADRPSKTGEIFAALGKKLAENGKLAAGAQGAQLQFNVREPASTWTVDLSGDTAKVVSGSASNPTTTFGIDDADLVALVKGEAVAQHLHQHGRLRVDGDARFAHQLAFLDKLI